MRKLYFLIASLAISFLSTFALGDCAILKNNSFIYKLGSKDVLVVFSETAYIEYHENKKYHIKSIIEWITDCEYNLIVQESTLPDFLVKKGTKTSIKIERIKGENVYYTATSGKRSWEWKMTKVKK